MPADRVLESAAERRESIWSVSERWRWLYFPFFLFLMSASSTFIIWHEAFGAGAGGGVVQSVVDVVMGEASAAVASAGLALCVTEGVMLSTLLIRKMDERKARLIKEGQKEGSDARDAEWDAWLERMLAAQAKGEPFAEPPPSRRARDANGKA